MELLRDLQEVIGYVNKEDAQSLDLLPPIHCPTLHHWVESKSQVGASWVGSSGLWRATPLFQDVALCVMKVHSGGSNA